MTISSSLGTLQPQIRDDIVFGPPFVSAGRLVYYLKDSFTNTFYRVGQREYFLISHMDGKRTLQQIEYEYVVTFKRRLSDQAWRQLFALLQKLGCGADLTLLQKQKQRTEEHRKTELHKTIAFHLSPSFFERPVACLHLFHPVFVYLAFAGVVFQEVFFLFNADKAVHELAADLFNYPWSIPCIVLFALLFMITHELAHGLACVYFGGSVDEVGIGLHIVFPYAYCKVDDILLFHRRYQRFFTAFAGIFTNLIMLLPCAILWWLYPGGGLLRTITDFLFVAANVTVLINLLPFFGTDGYLMLKHLCNMIDLQKDTLVTWRRLLSTDGQLTVFKLDRYQRIHFAYGLLTIIFALVCLVTILLLLLSFVCGVA